ncbi:MAG TPA: hypothetical protein DCM64_02725 [Gammaproteobacteria bacterium]|nr:hypothetical protein [Gammaproteobacteria bacterium]
MSFQRGHFIRRTQTAISVITTNTRNPVAGAVEPTKDSRIAMTINANVMKCFFMLPRLLLFWN